MRLSKAYSFDNVRKVSKEDIANIYIKQSAGKRLENTRIRLKNRP